MLSIIGKSLRKANALKVIGSAARSLSDSNETFINGSSIAYVERMYDSWKEDPKSVHVSWQAYFSNVAKGITPAFIPPPSLGGSISFTAPAKGETAVATSAKDLEDHVKVFQLITAFQLKGHELCDLDPLSKQPPRTFNRIKCRI
jgi:2-oxoglutarate dehydrogenase E1 component